MIDKVVCHIMRAGKEHKRLKPFALTACRERMAKQQKPPGPGTFRTIHRPASRVMAVVLSVCMMFTLMPLTESAAEVENGLCGHHSAHTTECGYQDAKPGQPCRHEHTEDCYTREFICGYTEGGNARASESNAKHTHSQDCYALDCPHDRGEHPDDCGFREGGEGTPCGHLCEFCDSLAGSGNPGNEIEVILLVAIDGLDEAVGHQSVPAGTSMDTLVLPDTLSATARTGEEESEPVVVHGVTWEPDRDYNGEPGNYAFTASAAGYACAQGVDWPVITVIVEDGAPALDEIDALCAAIDALPTVDELYENAPGDADPEFAAWVSDTRALLTEVPALWEQLLPLAEDAAAMERITEARAEKLAALNNLAERLAEVKLLNESAVTTLAALNQAITNSSGTAETPAVITIAEAGISVDQAIIIDNKHIKLTGGTLTRAVSYAGNLIEVKKGGSLTLETITLDGNKANASGGCLINLNNAALVLENGAALTNNPGSAVNIGFHFNGSSSITMNGGTISNNVSRESGGAIKDTDDGTVITIKGGKITGNAANGTDTDSTYGGAIYSSGTLIIEGGEITGNSTQNGRGGGIFKSGGNDKVFTVTGGTISGNTARTGENVGGSGHNVYVNKCTFTLGGAADIPDGLYLKLGSNSTFNIASALQNPVEIEAIYDHPKVGDLVASGALSYRITEEDLAKFSYKSGAFSFALNQNQMILAAPKSAAHTHDMSVECGNANPVSFDKMLTESVTAISASGNYYLEADVAITNNCLTITGEHVEVNLCLNGHTFTTGSVDSEVILVENGATLNLCDCRPDASNSTSISDPVTGSAVVVTGGLITGGAASSLAGGGVNCRGGLNLYGGTIAGNVSASGGGGVLVYAGGVFHMYGGAIRANKAANYGGGVYVYTESTLDNPPLEKGQFFLHGGQITGNGSGSYGGGVFNEGEFCMDGGGITGNTADVSGGGLWGASFVLSGGEVKGNHAKTNAGGVCMNGYDTSSFVLQDSPVITDNTSGDNSVASNLWFQNGQTVTVGSGGLTMEAKIGVRSPQTVPQLFPLSLTGNNNADYSARFTSDDLSRIIQNGDNNEVRLAILPTPTATNNGLIYAKGAPLLLAAGSPDQERTVIYIDRDYSGNLTDADTIFNPNIGAAVDGTIAGNDLRLYSILGGGLPFGTVTGDTMITMIGGNVSGIYGGGDGTVVGNTSVAIKGGTVGYLYGGGGYSTGTVTGNTSVTAVGGQVRYLYGGGEAGAAVGGSRVVTLGGDVKVGSAQDPGSGVMINGGSGNTAERDGVASFAIAPALTGGNDSVCVVLPTGFDVSVKPAIATGAALDDQAKIKLAGGGAAGREAYFDNGEIKVRAKSADATLSALSYSVGGGPEVSVPDFESGREGYHVILPYGTVQNAAITLTGTCNDSNAAVTENNGVILSGGSGTADIKVTAENETTTKTYTVRFTTAADTRSNAKQITAFTIQNQVGNTVIDQNNHTITVTMPSGTSVASLTPSITVSEKASVNPQSGAAQNFTGSVTYTVTAENETIQNYTVTVKVLTPTVTGVTVFPAMANVQKGSTRQFTAFVVGGNSPAQTVTWSLEGNHAGGTNISEGGLLTVDSSESQSTLTVKAVSTVDTSKSGTAAVTVTAQEKPRYTLTVNNGNGSGEYAEGEQITVTANTQANKRFKAWIVSGITLADAAANPVTIIMPAGAVTLTATYEEEAQTAYTVTFNTNGGRSLIPNTAQTGGDGKLSSLPVPARGESYSFAGWYTAAIGGTRVTLETVFTENTEIYAHWTYTGGDDGDSNSSDSGTPSEIKPDVPVVAQTEIKAQSDGRGGDEVIVQESTVNAAIRKAQEEAARSGIQENGIAVQVNVAANSQDAASLTVNLPKVTQEQIIKNKVQTFALVLERPDITLSLNLASVQEINRQANADVQLTAVRLTDTSRLSGEAKAVVGSRPVFRLTVTYKGGTKTITDFGSGSVTIAMSYKLQPDEAAGGLYLVYIDEQGKPQFLTNSSYDRWKEVLQGAASHFSLYAVGYKVPDAYSDIADHWAEEDIEFVAARGLMTGVENGRFNPDGAMTRAMFVTALGRLAGIDPADYSASSFTDVSASAYYAPYAAWAQKTGVVKDIGGGLFAPDQNVSRQEMAVIMANYAKVMGRKMPVNREAMTFTDNADIASWAADAVKTMQQAGVLMGKDGSRFDPLGSASRAQAAAVLRRYVELVIDQQTAQGVDVNDSGSAMLYENGRLVRSASRTAGASVYRFNQK